MANKEFKKASSSVSQCNKYDSCQRQWFFGSVDYLPQKPKRSTGIGDCTHFVLENFLEVDENGLKDGKPPELYPEGWNVQMDYFKTKALFVLDDKEQAMVKAAVAMAEKESIIVRQPNAVVEYNTKVDVTPDVHFTVRIDYAFDWTIEDHKTCKNWRYTLHEDPKDPERYVGNDVQLRVYAYFWAKKREEEGHEIPEYMTVCHNQFRIDTNLKKPQVRKVQADVKFSDCEKTWLEVKELILEQLEWRKKKHNDGLTAWQVPLNLRACSNYGGCSFKSVCMAQETAESYKNRVNNYIDTLTFELNKKDEVNIMSGFSLASGGATSAQADVLNKIDNPPKEETPVSTETKTKQEELDGLLTAMKAGGLQDEQIEAMPNIVTLRTEIKAEADAKAAEEAAKKAEAKAKADAEAAAKKAEADRLAALEGAEKEAKLKEICDKVPDPKADAKAAAKSGATGAKATATIKSEPKADVDEDFEIKANPADRRGNDVTVLIGCSVMGGSNTKIISINQIFAKKSAQMAKDMGKSSFYELEPFTRREAFMQCAPQIIEELGGFHVTACVTGPDTNALLEAIISDPKVRVFYGK